MVPRSARGCSGLAVTPFAIGVAVSVAIARRLVVVQGSLWGVMSALSL
ncbi:hypothetical protein ACXC9Q_22615 [Kribbella sp. CWNU-51]